MSRPCSQEPRRRERGKERIGDTERGLGPDPAARGHDGRPPVHGLPRRLAAFRDPGRRPDRGDVRGRHRLRRLERRRLAGDQRGRPAGRPAARDGPDRPVHGAADPDDDLQHPGPDHPAGLHPRPPQHRPQGRQLHAEHRAGRHLPARARSSSSSSSTTSGSTSAGTRRSTTSTRSRGPGTAAGSSSPNLGYKPGSGLGYFPCPPTDSLADLRTEMAQRMAECGIATSAHYHEVATGGQCEIDLDAPAPGRERRPGDAGQVHHPQRRPPQRQDRDVHAQAALRRQRLGHAHPLLALEGRGPAPRRQRLRRPERPGPVRHRRPAQARPGALRVRQPDDQQLQAAVDGLRGPDQALVQPPQPRGGHPDPGPQPEPAGAGGSSTAAPTARPTPTCSSRPC